jgi:hypothetical protein
LNLPLAEKRELLKFCEKNHIPLISTSAKDNVNVQLVFDTCARIYPKRPEEGKKK